MEDNEMSCECTPVAETRFGEAPGQSASVAVVEAVAAAEDVAPTELDQLYETIDPDAIDRLFARHDGSSASVNLRLSVAGWQVFVRGDGGVRVCDPDRITEPAATFEKSVAD